MGRQLIDYNVLATRYLYNSIQLYKRDNVMTKITHILLIKKEGCDFCNEVVEPTKKLCAQKGISLDIKMKDEVPKYMIKGAYPFWWIGDGKDVWGFHPDMEGSIEDLIDQIESQ